MISTNILAIVGLIASSVLASTPQGYGYGGMTDSIIGSSTDSPDSMPSSIMPITITDSITVTKPVTITHTVTVSQPDCGSDYTTIYSTTRTTRTTDNTIYISIHQTPKTATQTPTSVSGMGSTFITGSISTPSTTGFIMSNTTTPCESDTSTSDVDGITGSPTTSSMSTLTLAIPPSQETTSEVISGAAHSTTGILVTRTSTSTIPFSTIPTSMGIHSVADTQLLAGAMGLVFLVFALAL
ncbi:hypothetical protein F5B22DRAFT_314493 [Xylaria bambusicola]|uniref:uncharacterized protein n=1 Tax=Xylaria bambusicola TaxID=326684 RepID=UPI00200750F6|nr:uncharacterized protein F5B22DRAFT_314493 [Xylaria bambusicola]KAI0509744.1 hypothetical protein F5B22DRAFT_314493 [Xylaria bambusicola]